MQEKIQEMLQRITATTIIVGVDTGKESHWARVTDYRGVDLMKPVKVTNDIKGFDGLMSRIEKVRTARGCDQVIIGTEPSGHYWRAFGWYLKLHPSQPMLVGVNPFHTKQAKELDDNSQTRSDKKDALVIAHLIRDGRFFDTYLPKDVYAELRVFNTERQRIMKQISRASNTIIALMDEFFPEYRTVFKNVTCPTSCEILRIVPFPTDVLSMGREDLIALIRQASGGTEGQKLADELVLVATNSVGVLEGKTAVRFRLKQLLEELTFHQKQKAAVEEQLNAELKKLGLGEILQSMPGIGPIIAAAFLGEVGDVDRFDTWKQLRKLAGLNLTENSSGKRKGKTTISKRGRPYLRHMLYMAGEACILHNEELRQLYYYFRRRSINPLKYNQAVVAVGLKAMRVLFYMAKTKAKYDPSKALGDIRKEQIAQIA
jgi:transposase